MFKVFDRSYSIKVEVEKTKRSVAFFILEMVIIFATVTALFFNGYEIWKAREDRRLARVDRELAQEDRKCAEEDREAEGIARNWAILNTPASGNSGKKQAIEYLVSRGEPLQNIDLSCARWGGEKTEKIKTGKMRPIVTGVPIWLNCL